MDVVKDILFIFIYIDRKILIFINLLIYIRNVYILIIIVINIIIFISDNYQILLISE
jgi:hypothetical protein